MDSLQFCGFPSMYQFFTLGKCKRGPFETDCEKAGAKICSLLTDYVMGLENQEFIPIGCAWE